MTNPRSVTYCQHHDEENIHTPRAQTARTRSNHPMNTWNEIRKDGILVEDRAILTLNKPAGISVMGERHESDITGLAQEAGEQIFPVHRIDKVTSGVILFAKELGFHGALTRQFNKRTVDKVYLAITRSTGLPDKGVIDLPLSAGRKSRVRIAAPRENILVNKGSNHWSVKPSTVLTNTKTYPSVTTFVKVWSDEHYTLLAIQPMTGRRHQIRVHLAWIDHPIEGDPLFYKANAARGERTYLHSWRLAFDAAWLGGKRIDIEAIPGEEFWTPVRDNLPGQNSSAMPRHARRAITDAGHAET